MGLFILKVWNYELENNHERIFDIFFYHRLSNDKIDAIATANILNFIGLSINNFRKYVVQKNILLPKFYQYL